MASKKKKVAKAAKGAVPFDPADLANITKANPYIQRLIQDAELRDNVRNALDHARTALDRLTSSKAPQKAVLEDKKLQSEIREAAFAVRDAALALNDAPKHPKGNKAKKKKGFGFGKVLLLAGAGAGAALAASESLRSKVLDTLFGAEEEFQYTPPAGPPAPAPASPVTAA